MAKNSMTEAVAIPNIVLIFCFDFHSEGNVSKVIIDMMKAKTMKIEVKLKKRRALLRVLQLMKMQSPMRKTETGWFKSPELRSCLPNALLLF